MDIKQHPKARAAITVGKDTTFRDFAQGAYRMRGMAKGQPQKIDIVLVPEVLGLIKKDLGDGACTLPPRVAAVSDHSMALLGNDTVRAVFAWLLLNQIRLESKQTMQLLVQNVDAVTRRKALAGLLGQWPGSGGGAPLQTGRGFFADCR
jgi:hypothetical protein